MRHAGDARDVEHVATRIPNGLAVEGACLGADRCCPGLKIIGVVDEVDRDSELGQGVVEEVVSAAVE